MSQELSKTEDYYAQEACHSGMIMNYWKTNALIARQRQLEDKKATQAMDFGNLVHTMVLEPEKLAERYITKPDFGDCRSPKNRVKRDEWLDDHTDMTAVTAQEMDDANKMRAQVWTHPTAKRLLSDCESFEKEIYWSDKSTGVPCKAKIDGLSDNYTIDLKTAASTMSGLGGAHPKNMKKVIADRMYFIQAAFYRMAAEQADDLYGRQVYIIFVEKELPFSVGVCRLNIEYLNYGMGICQQFLEIYQQAIVTDDWPDYGEDVVEITAPAWLMRD